MSRKRESYTPIEVEEEYYAFQPGKSAAKLKKKRFVPPQEAPKKISEEELEELRTTILETKKTPIGEIVKISKK